MKRIQALEVARTTPGGLIWPPRFYTHGVDALSVLADAGPGLYALLEETSIDPPYVARVNADGTRELFRLEELNA